MNTQMNATLRAHNTFGFDVLAQHLVEIQELADVPLFFNLAYKEKSLWQVFGGGSNLVLAKNLSGYTGLMQIKGRSLVRETQTHWYVNAMAGENWHEFVVWTIEQSYFGLENLALIPGTVGAAPIQNIGAYGLELADVCESVKAFDTQTQDWVTLTRSECQFDYRDSIFKRDSHRYIVVSVCFALPKVWQPNFRYAELAKAFENSANVSAQDVLKKVCEIRQSKLPDPRVLGNAGSFFHNPIVTNNLYLRLKSQYPNIVAYPVGDSWKLAAGWLVDQCGFKGYQSGPVGVYKKQALVLVHQGGGDGKMLLRLARQIQDKVSDTFGVDLSIEPVVFD
jgi:UDP-N-acetylmuramate dehydrogenase